MKDLIPPEALGGHAGNRAEPIAEEYFGDGFRQGIERTKEACKKACKEKAEKQESPDGLYLYELEQAIDEVKV